MDRGRDCEGQRSSGIRRRRSSDGLRRGNPWTLTGLSASGMVRRRDCGCRRPGIGKRRTMSSERERQAAGIGALIGIIFSDEPIAMSDEILKVESEIDTRVKALYRL